MDKKPVTMSVNDLAIVLTAKNRTAFPRWDNDEVLSEFFIAISDLEQTFNEDRGGFVNYCYRFAFKRVWRKYWRSQGYKYVEPERTWKPIAPVVTSEQHDLAAPTDAGNPREDLWEFLALFLSDEANEIALLRSVGKTMREVLSETGVSQYHYYNHMRRIKELLIEYERREG